MKCNLEVRLPVMELGDVAIDSRGVRVMAIKDGETCRFLDLRDSCILQDKANNWFDLLTTYYNLEDVRIIKSNDLILSNYIECGGN